MSRYKTVTVPLVKGLDLSTDPATGSDALDYADNVQFTLDGVVKGRPGRSNALQFVPRDCGSLADPHWASAANLESTGFSSLGLHAVRDKNGVRPMLTTGGRLFAKDGTRWIDKGPAHCFKTSRTVYQVTAGTQGPIAQDFGRVQPVALMGKTVFQLMAPSGDLDRVIDADSTTDWKAGTSARCGTMTAALIVAGGLLEIVTRSNGADTVTATLLAVDAKAPTGVGDAPVICCSSDATNFWVVYRTTTANQYKVLRVLTDGTVTATFTGTYAGISSIWCDNTSVATDKVMVAVTGTAGLLIKTIRATTMVDHATDTTIAVGAGQDCVIGRESDTRFWWAYRVPDSSAGTIRIGVCTVATAASGVVYRVLYGDAGTGGSGSRTSDPRWTLCHQPILVSGRVFMTFGCSAGTDSGTWLTVDLSNWRFDGNSPGPFPFANPVARGQTNTLVFTQQPQSATVLSDDTGWTFASIDYTRFYTVPGTTPSGLVQGTDPAVGLNKVILLRPRAAQFGESTVFSGSVPFHIAGGQCAELGFPFMAGVPGLDAAVGAGGAVAVGTYQLVACWVYYDEAGQIHRSAPSPQWALTTSAGNQTLKAWITNPWLHGKEFGEIRLELYVSGPGGSTILYLQSTVSANFNDGYTAVTLTATPSTSRETLYTTGGVFANIHVPGDGGVAALGRRLWLATGNVVWASKYRLDGLAPEFSDAAGLGGLPPLRIALPTGAGRVLALEAMDSVLTIFCERGVFAIPDGGPDNTGVGPDFSSPQRVSDLGCANSRSTIWTDRGIAFVSPLDATEPQIGGVWLLDRGLSVSLLSRQIAGRADRTWMTADAVYPPELAYCPERQWLLMTADGPSPALAVLDTRVGKWMTWSSASNFKHVTSVAGVVWASEATAGPRPFDRTDGTDDSSGGNITMTLLTSHLPAGQPDLLSWSRVRSVEVLGTKTSGAHSRTLNATLDQEMFFRENPTNPFTVSVSAASSSSSWPTNRQYSEWRLPVQKCGTIQLQLSASPALAEWVALKLEILPLSGKAPSKNRM